MSANLLRDALHTAARLYPGSSLLTFAPRAPAPQPLTAEHMLVNYSAVRVDLKVELLP